MATSMSLIENLARAPYASTQTLAQRHGFSPIEALTGQAGFTQTLVGRAATGVAGLEVGWANHLDEVREAQRLRHEVFAGEMGAQVDEQVKGHDIDVFDDHCEHLIVRCLLTSRVVGTYRLLMPTQRRIVGHWYTETEFDLSACGLEPDSTVELGRSCVHPDYRNGAVIMGLWSALISRMHATHMQTMIGCASISLNAGGVPSPVGLCMAANVYKGLGMYLVGEHEQATPRVSLPVDAVDNDLPAQPPALLRAYLRLGSRVLGPPAWDSAFNTADLALRLRVKDLPPRFRRDAMSAMH
jgi:putative hemolysin